MWRTRNVGTTFFFLWLRCAAHQVSLVFVGISFQVYTVHCGAYGGIRSRDCAFFPSFILGCWVSRVVVCFGDLFLMASSILFGISSAFQCCTCQVKIAQEERGVN